MNTNGSLDIFSSFNFKNYLGFLKKSSRKPNQSLQQIVNRIYKKSHVDIAYDLANHAAYPILKVSHNDGPLRPALISIKSGRQTASLRRTI